MTLSLIPPDDIRLRMRSTPACRPDIALVGALAELMAAHNGLGIAAPQVGRLTRLCLIPGDNGQVRAMFNPEIIATSDTVERFGEGCLSFPGRVAMVWRHNRVTVRYRDAAWCERVVPLSGLAAICVQHEIDHLDGVLAHMREEGR